MWLIVRIFIAVGALVYRLFFRRTPARYDQSHGDLPYAERIVRRKKKPHKRYYETPVDSAFVCVLSKETALDRFFKGVGLGGELQTADPAFDKVVYVLGDHPLTLAYLTSKPTARETILDLIRGGALSLSITGESLRLELPESFDTKRALDGMATLARELRAIQGDVRSRFADPSYDTAVVMQALVVSAVAYGAFGIFESMYVKPDYHVKLEPVVWAGLIVACSFTLAVLSLIWLLLRRSSYAPRLVKEQFLWFLPLCFSGFQLVSDMNRTWDRSPGWIVSYRVDDVQRVLHKQRRARSYYTYHATLSELPSMQPYPVAVPSRLEINKGLYRALLQEKQLSMDVGGGALGFPWYRDVWAGPATP
jgi:hypothetical protein